MKIPVDLEKIIEISDPIYTFNEIMEQIYLYKYFAEKCGKTGRPRFDAVKLLICGTKFEADANKYTWVWKKACITSRKRVYMYPRLASKSKQEHTSRRKLRNY